MAKRPPLNALRAFEAASRHLNFRKAADELALTQSAVAQQVRHLEASLSVNLFKRHARGLALTEQGQLYAVRIAIALKEIADATAELHTKRPSLTVSATPSFATKWLIPRLQSFTDARPDCDIRIDATERIVDLDRENIDLAIRMLTTSKAESLSAIKLLPSCISAYASPKLVSANWMNLPKQAIQARIKDFALIHDAHNHWQRWFGAETIQTGFPSQLHFSQTAMATDAAIAGQGIVLASDCLVSRELEHNMLHRLFETKLEDNKGYYILRRKAAPSQDLTDFMSDWLLTEASKDSQSL